MAYTSQRHCAINAVLFFQTRRISDESLAYFYQNLYWDIVRTKKSTYTPEKDVNDYSKIAGLLNNRNNIEILEVGCGSGSRILTLAKVLDESSITYSASATDFIDEPDSMKLSGITYHKGVTLPQNKTKFDVVILSHIIEHFTRPDLFLDDLSARLNQGALVYIEVPGIHDIVNKRGYEYSYDVYVNLAHNYNFTLVSLAQLLASRGFQLLFGTEEIKALFTKTTDLSQPYTASSNGESLRIKQSLAICESKSVHLRSTVVYKLKALIKSLLSSLQLR